MGDNHSVLKGIALCIDIILYIILTLQIDVEKNLVQSFENHFDSAEVEQLFPCVEKNLPQINIERAVNRIVESEDRGNVLFENKSVLFNQKSALFDPSSTYASKIALSSSRTPSRSKFVTSNMNTIPSSQSPSYVKFVNIKQLSPLNKPGI